MFFGTRFIFFFIFKFLCHWKLRSVCDVGYVANCFQNGWPNTICWKYFPYLLIWISTFVLHCIYVYTQIHFHTFNFVLIMLIVPTIVSYMSDYHITCWTDASLLLCPLKFLLANLLPWSSLPDEPLRRFWSNFPPKRLCLDFYWPGIACMLFWQ